LRPKKVDLLWDAAVIEAAVNTLMIDVPSNVVYALITHPGHHADADACGGYCYINQAAVTVETLLLQHAAAGLEKVAVLDVDYHVRLADFDMDSAVLASSGCGGCTVRVFRQRFTLAEWLAFHAFESLPCV
jgi:hypothetical protein